MKTVYRIFGKIALLCYLILLYQTWHLCRYGGVRHHFMILLPVGAEKYGGTCTTRQEDGKFTLKILLPVIKKS